MLLDQATKMPNTLKCGRIPTLNQRGFSTEFPDPHSEKFIKLSIGINEEVLDIGCAFGVVVKRVLQGGGRICASDMDKRHLDIISQSIDDIEGAHDRLRCVTGKLPMIDFDEGAFGAILCSRVLHFMTGDEVEQSLAKMNQWLSPGGKLFLVVDTPYSGVSSKKVVPEYHRKKALGDKWPGFIPEFDKFMPANSKVKFGTSFIHLMDPDILERACKEAGFEVESKGYMARIANLSNADPEGRDHAITVATKI